MAMRIILSIVTGLFFLATLTMPGNAQMASDGQGSPAETWRQSDGDFGAILIVTDDPEKLMSDWQQQSEIQVEPLIEASPGDKVAAFILFSGCKSAPDGTCKATVSFTLVKPDGSVYGEQLGAGLWEGVPVPPEGSLQLSMADLVLVIESQDPSGVYTINALVQDPSSMKTVKLEQKFTVIK